MPSVLSWPFVKAPGASALTPLTAVCLYLPALDQVREDLRQGRGELIGGEDLLSQLSGDLLSLGLGVRFRVPGTSMHPTIRHGDVITVEPVEPGNLKGGEIILYRRRSNFIAHRIVKIEERDRRGLTFIVRGDASVTCDAPVKPKQVLGKIVCLERDHRIIDPYSRRVRLWSMLYRWLGHLKRNVFERFLPRSLQRQEIRSPSTDILVNGRRI